MPALLEARADICINDYMDASVETPFLSERGDEKNNDDACVID